jgi:hypothetical protein
MKQKFRNYWSSLALYMGVTLFLLSGVKAFGVDMLADFGLFLGGVGWILLAMFMKPSFRRARFNDLFEGDAPSDSAKRVPEGQK